MTKENLDKSNNSLKTQLKKKKIIVKLVTALDIKKQSQV